MNALIRISHAAFSEIQNALFDADLPSDDTDGVLHLSGVNLADESVRPADPLDTLLDDVADAAVRLHSVSDALVSDKELLNCEAGLIRARTAVKQHIETLKATK